MDKLIFDKTDKGREEIATRKYGLAPRMRSLLVLVDGKKNKTDLLNKVAGLGLNEQSIVDLIDNNFIGNAADMVHAAPAVPAPVVAPVPAVEVISEVIPEPEPKEIVPEEPPPPPPPPPPIKVIAPEELQALHNFFNETIKSTIGLRGFSLHQKAESAVTLDDFRELRLLYLEAVLKAKGKDVTVSLRDRLDHLLDNAEETAT